MSDDVPRVWIGSLAAYNNGDLIGKWFDAIDAPTEPIDWVRAMFPATAESNPHYAARLAQIHEELWVFDHENFDGLLTGECSPAEARTLAEALAEVDDNERPAFAAFCSDRGERPNADSLADLVESFRESFCGYYDRESDYAWDLAEEIGAVPEGGWPLSCIDWDKAWNELRIGGDNWSEYIDGHGYAIFRTCY